jgi:hypothetical protein
MKPTIAAIFGGLLVFFLLLPTTTAFAFGPATVINANDAGPGSLRAAMASGATQIDFDPGFFGVPRTIKLDRPLPYIQSDLSIVGPGAAMLTIDGQLKANPESLLTILDSSTTVRLEGFTLTGGYDAFSTGHVGGIFSRGKLTLANLKLNNNRGTALFSQGGSVVIEQSAITGNTGQGAIFQGGEASIKKSMIHGNLAQGVFVQSANATIDETLIGNNSAEGTFNQAGTLTLRNSTVTLNGGGIYNQVGNLAIYNCTIAGNREYGVGSITSNPQFIRTFKADSTIFAHNAQLDLFADVPASINYSLIEFVETTINGVGNVLGVDPKLGVLSLNGGTTLNFLPLPGSPAIDAGSNPLNLAIDQRGFARAVAGRADIGAVEAIPEPATAVLLVCAAGGFAVRRLPLAA